jgi:hypothetical protein
MSSGRTTNALIEGTPMKPTIQETEFGRITVDHIVHERDILIRPSGKVKKRKKKLSKKVSDSHVISLAEAKHIFGKGADRLIIGTGQEGHVQLSEEAQAFFREEDCLVELFPTPRAIEVWNQAEGKAIAMFHVNC